MDWDSGMTHSYVNLDIFLRFMRYKLELRKKRPPNSEKWPLDAVDADGNRDWRKVPPKRLRVKLDEEVDELMAEFKALEEGAMDEATRDKIAFEAADVALVAFMIADRAGVDWEGIVNAFNTRAPK